MAPQFAIFSSRIPPIWLVFITAIFVMSIILVPLQPIRAYYFAVSDIIDYVFEAIKIAAQAVIKSLTDAKTFKTYVLDPLAYIAIQTLLKAMTNQILGWIQGRDSGFVQNLQAEALRGVDAEAGNLLNKISTINLCGNIGAFLKLSIGAPNASFRQRMQCSVTGIVGNFQNFYDNFANGGWPAFFSISLEPQNNAYGAYLLALNEQAQLQSGRQEAVHQRLSEGKGFLGFDVPREANCQYVSREEAAALKESAQVQDKAPGAPKRDKPEQSIKLVQQNNEDGAVSAYQFCDVQYDTKTPGDVFATGLNESVFSGKHSLEYSNSIGTLVNAAFRQIIGALIQKTIAASVGGGQGVLGTRELSQLPTTVAGAFNPTFMTDRTDDGALRLGASQALIDAKIQDIKNQIATIDVQIVALQKICTDNPPACDQKQINKLTVDKAPLQQDLNDQIALLSRANSDMGQILDIRRRIFAAQDPALLKNLEDKLLGLQTDLLFIVQQAGGPPEGQQGTDPDDNFVKITTNTQDRATAIVAYLNKQIAAETDTDKKAALGKARDDLKKLADELAILRTAFLDAISKDIGTAGIMTQITGKIGEINDKILSVYSL